jgi:hypothetical protein
MIREHRGSLKVEERLGGDAVWVLRFKVTRDSDHKWVERTLSSGESKTFPRKLKLLRKQSAGACMPSNQDRNAEP